MILNPYQHKYAESVDKRQGFAVGVLAHLQSVCSWVALTNHDWAGVLWLHAGKQAERKKIKNSLLLNPRRSLSEGYLCIKHA